MRTQSLGAVFVLVLALLSPTQPLFAQQPGEMEIRQGVIEQITEISLPTNHHRGVGAIVGGLGAWASAA